MLKLHYAPRTISVAVAIILEELEIPHEAIRVDFATAEQTKDSYRRINPKGRVPTLVTDRGTLTENPAILAWVAQQYPEAGLAPLDDPFEFARLQSFNSYLCATVHVAHAHSRRGERWADDAAAIAEMKRKAPEVVADCFELIENGMFAGPWVMGEDYTVADGYLFTIAQWLPGHRINIARYPKIRDHLNRMLQRPAVKETIMAEGGR